MEHLLTITAEPAVISEMAELARRHDARSSEPELLNMDGALNAGMTAEEFRQALEVITLLFKTGAAAFTFLTAARAYLRDRKSPASLTIRDEDGKVQGRISAGTSDAELAHFAPVKAGGG